MRLNLNTSGAQAARQLNATVKQLEGSVGRLASGDRIASATDDAAGLVISNRLRAQVSGLRIRDLALRASNTAISDVGIRTGLKNEADQLLREGQRVIERTTFGGMQLLIRTPGSQVDVQVGIGATSNDRISIPLEIIGFILLPGVTDDIVPDPHETVLRMEAMAGVLHQYRGQMGALGNRFESIVATLQIASEHVAAGESYIRNTDMAAEMVGYTKQQVMRDASSAMLAQASRIHENLLGLLAA